MNNLYTIETAPLTWLDVERRLKKATQLYRTLPPCIAAIRCFSDVTEIDFSTTKQEAQTWLRDTVFKQFMNVDGESVALGIGNTNHHFEFAKVESISDPIIGFAPLWDQQVYLDNAGQIYPTPWQEGPKMLAFHSFKGGVGRTTALMTFASAFANQNAGQSNDQGKKILLIDGDFEAPGISFWLDPKNRPSVSFVQLLEALHYPPKDIGSTLEFFATQLRKTSLEMHGGCEIFVLPSALDLAEIMDMPVQPEHLARDHLNPWCLSDYLQQLGRILQVEVVMVDLRAGLSELASPLLFDPRIEHYFVSTIAPQSILGMEQILRRMYGFQSKFSDVEGSKPSVILSMLTEDLRKLPEYEEALEKLNEAFPCVDPNKLESGLDWLEANFDSNLMSLRSVRQALDQLQRSSLYPSAEKWAEGKSISRNVAKPIVPETQNDGAATKLFNTCKAFQFAETTNTGDMLMTEPLRNLAKHFSEELPNAVSVGAKGAGKTFAFVQLCRYKTWQGFLQSASADPSAVNKSMSVIFPAMVSTNLEGLQREVIDQAREHCLTQLGIPSAQDTLGVSISQALRIPGCDWNAKWEEILLAPFATLGNSFEDISQTLNASGHSLVLIVDGIEDHFDTPDNEEQREAIKALLQIPNRLGAIRGRKIGFVCFVREDFVQLAIRQNLQQYLARFDAFKLMWTPETFLRLIYWICGKAGVINAKAENVSNMSVEQLLLALEALWGKKLGSDAGKEANSARWVFSALCDYNGRLQARDVVRFLRFAAHNSQASKPSPYSDRLLAPDAMRKALVPCSDEKVKEALLEIKPLRDWSSELEKISLNAKNVPFSFEAVALNPAALSNLIELGVIYENKDQGNVPERYYLPEIYRIGLRFNALQAGRPKILAFLKRNLGVLPF